MSVTERRATMREILTREKARHGIDAHDEIRYDLRRPCASCPFVRSTPLHEGIARGLIEEYVWSIERGSFSHSCHQTCADPSCDGNPAFTGPLQHCAGAVAFLIKMGNEVQVPLLRAIDDGRLSLKRMTEYRELAKSDDVYTLRGMLSRYVAWLEEMKRNDDAPNGRTLTRKDS